jgi:hypothetical protein
MIVDFTDIVEEFVASPKSLYVEVPSSRGE